MYGWTGGGWVGGDHRVCMPLIVNRTCFEFSRKEFPTHFFYISLGWTPLSLQICSRDVQLIRVRCFPDRCGRYCYWFPPCPGHLRWPPSVQALSAGSRVARWFPPCPGHVGAMHGTLLATQNPATVPSPWPGLALPVLAWPGLAWPWSWPCLAWPGLARPGLGWPVLAWPGLRWPVLAWPGLALAGLCLAFAVLCLACVLPGLAWPGLACLVWPAWSGQARPGLARASRGHVWAVYGPCRGHVGAGRGHVGACRGHVGAM